MSDLVERLRELSKGDPDKPAVMLYVRDIRVLLAALDAQPVGLDVARLAKAMHAYCEREWQAVAAGNPGRALTLHGADAHTDEATLAASAYAAFASEPQP
jgi:hypothetical protein